MRKLFQRQLGKASSETGEVDIDKLAELVVAAYEDAGRDRRRTDRSIELMAQEVEQKQEQLLEAFDDLKRREESFRLLFDDNPIPMWILELDTNKFLAVNNAVVSHYGYSREQFLSMTAFDLRSPEDRKIFQGFARDSKPSQGSVVWKHFKSDGSPILVTIYSRFIVHNGRPSRLAAIVDVTERKHADEKLHEQKLHTDTALSNMSQGLVMFDAQQRMALCNSRYIEIYNFNPEVVKPGCTLRELSEHRKEIGLLSGDPEERSREILTSVAKGQWTDLVTLPDGRYIQKITRPMPGGGWVATHEDVTERKQVEARILYIARHDPLTDIANRTVLLEKMDEALVRLRQNQEAFTIIMFDIDGFKYINDTLGHAAGDELLKELAQRLTSALRETDFLARLGGDEFAIIQKVWTNQSVNDRRDADQREAAIGLALKVLEIVAHPFDLCGHNVTVGASIGIAFAPVDGTDCGELLQKADLALYRVKSEGRNNFCFYEAEMSKGASERLKLLGDMRAALTRKEFELYYQPIFDAKTRQPCGVEALVRWRHPVHGLLTPDRFIPLAEESGLMERLGEWILEQACTAAAAWPAHLKVAVNLSVVQFRSGKLFDVILCALLESGLPPERLELEITESVLIQNGERYGVVIQQLKNLGISIALDDFGTGFSSLSYLTMFPFDKIKIDKSFTQGLTYRADCAAIVASVLTLARGLEMIVTAEGVETKEQFELLRIAGVHQMQGYLFAQPIPLVELNYSKLEQKGQAIAAA